MEKRKFKKKAEKEIQEIGRGPTMIPDDRKWEGRLCLNTETFLTLDREFP